MKLYRLYILVALLAVVSCGDEKEEIIPADISNLRSESSEGAITLKWDQPDRPDWMMVQVEYMHPVTGEYNMRVASSYADTLRVDGLLRRYGEFTFSARTVSKTNTPGNALTVNSTAGAVPPVYTPVGAQKLNITVGMLSANASDPSEGVLANLIDGNTSTFYTSNWRSDRPAMPHWLQIDLNEPIEGIQFGMIKRQGPTYDTTPGNVEILVSTDGTNWALIGTIDENVITVDSGSDFTYTEYFVSDVSFNKVRFNVISSEYGYWALSELEVLKVLMEVYDPENE